MHIPQATTSVLLVNIHVTTKLPIYGNGVPIQQSVKVNSYPQLGGELLGGSPNEGLLEEDHLIATHLDFTNGKHLIQ